MIIQVRNHGSVWGLTPLDLEAEKFVADVGAESWQFIGPTLVLDHRVARDFIAQAKDDGVEFIS